MKIKYKTLFRIAGFLILLGLVSTSQYLVDQQKKKRVYAEPVVIPAEILKVAGLGLDNALADFLWLGSIQYFGGGESRTNEKLSDFLVSSTDLDPKFSYPYAFGALILPSIEETELAISLAKKGIDKAEPNWQIPYNLATLYHIEKKDRANAIKYFDLAATTPGAPDNIQKIAANFGTYPTDRARSAAIWQGILENTSDETVKERAEMYLAHYAILDLLEDAAKRYHDINGFYPKDLQNLIDARILRAIPKDPFGFEYTIDINGRAVSR